MLDTSAIHQGHKKESDSISDNLNKSKHGQYDGFERQAVHDMVKEYQQNPDKFSEHLSAINHTTDNNGKANNWITEQGDDGKQKTYLNLNVNGDIYNTSKDASGNVTTSWKDNQGTEHNQVVKSNGAESEYTYKDGVYHMYSKDQAGNNTETSQFVKDDEGNWTVNYNKPQSDKGFTYNKLDIKNDGTNVQTNTTTGEQRTLNAQGEVTSKTQLSNDQLQLQKDAGKSDTYAMWNDMKNIAKADNKSNDGTWEGQYKTEQKIQSDLKQALGANATVTKDLDGGKEGDANFTVTTKDGKAVTYKLHDSTTDSGSDHDLAVEHHHDYSNPTSQEKAGEAIYNAYTENGNNSHYFDNLSETAKKNPTEFASAAKKMATELGNEMQYLSKDGKRDVISGLNRTLEGTSLMNEQIQQFNQYLGQTSQ